MGTPGRVLARLELDDLRSLFSGGEPEGRHLEDRLEEMLRFHLGRVPRTSRMLHGLP
jgi:hypothetical protein